MAAVLTATFASSVFLIRYQIVDPRVTPLVGATLYYTQGAAQEVLDMVGLQSVLFANHRSRSEGWRDFAVFLLVVFLQWWFVASIFFAIIRRIRAD